MVAAGIIRNAELVFVNSVLDQPNHLVVAPSLVKIQKIGAAASARLSWPSAFGHFTCRHGMLTRFPTSAAHGRLVGLSLY